MPVATKKVEYLATEISRQKSKYIFWLGAGVSVTAGIPAGAGVVDRLLDLSWRDSQSSLETQVLERYSALAGAAKAERIKLVRDWALQNVLGGIAPGRGNKKTKQAAVEADWGAHYSGCLALLPGEEVRQKFIVECIKEGCGRLNLAHLLMSQLMVNDFVRIVLTTNFDDLLVRALQLYFEVPSIIDADSTHALMIESGFLQIAYLHGRLTSYRQRHTERELQKSMPDFESFIVSAMKDHGLVVVGYRGGDEAPMKILEKVLRKRGAGPGRGLFWVSHEKDFDKLSEGAQRILRLKDTYWLPGWDADVFFERLCSSHGIGLSLPDFLCEPKKFAGRLGKILPERARGPWSELQESGADLAGAGLDLSIAETSKLINSKDTSQRGEALIGAREGYQPVLLTAPERAAGGATLEDLVIHYRNAFDADATDWRALVRWAEVLVELERDDEAIQKYRQAENIHPLDSEALTSWGNALKRKNRLEEAIEKYRSAAAADSGNSWIFYYWANSLAEQGDFEAAILKYREAVERDPENSWALQKWGAALNAMGREDEAIEMYRQSIGVDPGNAWSLYAWAETLRMQGRYEEAIEKYQLAVDADPKHAWAISQLGAALEAQGRYEEAMDRYRAALEANPKHVWSLAHWGRLLQQLGRDEEAIEKYRLAADIDARYPSVLSNWGDLLQKEGRDEEAIDKYRLASETLPENARIFWKWGNALRKLGRNEEAEGKYRTASEIDPSFAPAFLGWGHSLQKLRRDAEAVEKFQRATELNPDLALGYFAWGHSLRRLNRDEEAVEKYRRATELNPKLSVAFAAWGQALRNMGRDEEAIERFRKAAEVDPRNWGALSAWGISLQILRRDQDAVPLLLSAISLNPKKASMHVSLAASYSRLNQQAEYAREIQLASELVGRESEYNQACYESVRGNTEDAITLLKTALEKRAETRRWASRDPDFDFIRNDPRFNVLVSEP
jgi:tetratricopeptide (TPR) repeat protein